MKKNILLTCLVITVMMLVLTGCGCEHTYSDATCTELATCSQCGETTGELAAHQYGEATCKELAACSACGATTGELAAHKYGEPTCKIPATCSVCGGTEGNVVDHKFSEATCAAPATCGWCGLTNGEALPHTFSEATCTAAATCSACGAVNGEPLPHTLTKATCQEFATCTVCGLTGTEKGAHSYNKGTCSVCGHQDPRYAEIKSILTKIERYPTYLKLDCSILETQVDLYKINGKASVLMDIIDKVDEMYGYVKKVRDACKDQRELKLLYDECLDVEYPGTSGSSSSAIRSYLSNVNKFKRQCGYVYMMYDVIAPSYGISVK